MNRTRKSGAVLVFTLAVLTAVVAVLAGAAAMQRLAGQAQVNRKDQARAELVALSGIQRALATLSTQNANQTSQNDEWYTLGTQGNDRFLIDEGTFRLQIKDTGSFVNLNSAPQPQLALLPLTSDQVDSLLDWRSAGNSPRPQGAKDEYYTQLTYPYSAAERNLNSLDELLLIKNFTPATLYSVPNQTNALPSLINGSQQDQPSLYELATTDSVCGNRTAAGAPKTNINTATAAQMTRQRIPAAVAQSIIAQRRRSTFNNMGAVLRVRGVTNNIAKTLIDNFSTSTNTTLTGRIDLNTAPQAVLATVPNMPTDVVQGIMSRQSGTGFASVGDLTSVPGMNVNALAQVVDQFSTSSQTFVVRVIGSAGDASVPLEAVVTLRNGTAIITRIMHPPYNDMRTLWLWADTPTNDVDLTSGGQGGQG